MLTKFIDMIGFLVYHLIKKKKKKKTNVSIFSIISKRNQIL